jgi:hypothetical protein
LSTLETILGALADAVEGIVPVHQGDVEFKRWRGAGLLGERPKPQPAARSFQWQLGASSIPRTMSGASDASTWLRTELLLVVAYDLGLPRAGDTAGLGPAQEIGADRASLWKTLALGNPLSSSSYHCKRMIPLSPWDGPHRGNTRSYRFDLEYTLE